ncbi:CO dehydrogenase/acetyl-CoA synthase delta subunit, TIM barrel [Desulfovibrio ferrophilus]|uniref:CO dehydrogenase/acetyl-CoA synthase delta subunit, TIM barrel n=1 Tax=Desulfovibrio ferrophilus TaxID=241368 RepID=A0A2Z6AZM0_9BACT|nr:CO dehydrogenase/acetyl-CoA synthase delta subunit, TIM barrel [Desulfovibrio ferrophilus]
MRDDYKIVPGLYGVGQPGSESPVIVTCNYKLTFDIVRRELTGLDVWLLVIDTHGINVWCAAGKGTFSTAEVAHRVQRSGLDKVVSHRKLILPQYGATGVSAHKLRKACGFGAEFGPIRAADLPRYLEQGADETMRRATFSLAERALLVPIEVTLLWKALAWGALVMFVLSGIGPDWFSLSAAWTRGGWALGGTLAGILAGAIAVPLLLPWLPGRAFSLKGAATGLVVGLGAAFWLPGGAHWGEGLGLLLWVTALSSYLGMNFTGSTPFTSPSGVEKEMRQAIPLQGGAVLMAVALWIGAAFMV